MASTGFDFVGFVPPATAAIQASELVNHLLRLAPRGSFCRGYILSVPADEALRFEAALEVATPFGRVSHRAQGKDLERVFKRLALKLGFKLASRIPAPRKGGRLVPVQNHARTLS